MSRHAYPPDLGRFVEAHWPEGAPAWTVPSAFLGEVLSVAYQASLTYEEARPTRFRLLMSAADALPEAGVPNQGVLRLRFDRSRPFHPDELRRLAPVAPFETGLIGVHAEDDALRIWGLAHSGPAWLAPAWGGRSPVPNWTHDPIVHVAGPGKVAVRCAGELIGALDRGLLVDATMDVFETEWLPAMFARALDEVRAEHDLSQATVATPTSVEPSLVGRVGQHMLRRAIQLVRGARHGGMFLVVDTDADAASRDLEGLRLKYRFERDEPPRRYRTLLLQILEAVAADASSPTVGWSDFATSESQRLEQLEQAMFEHSRVLANLAAVDGAVVLDKRLSLFGFGAEVSAELPAPARIFRALDAEAHERAVDHFENVGTRHRAAYRFVRQHSAGLAIVISQDGGVSFVANRGGEVVFWEQSLGP